MSEAEPNKIMRPGGRRIGTHDMSLIRAIVAAKQKAKAEAEAAGKSKEEVNAAISLAAAQFKPEGESKSKSKLDKPDKQQKSISIPAGYGSAILSSGKTISDIANNQKREDIPITGQTILGEGNAISDKTCPHRHVRLRMTMAERLKYVPPKGINVLFYAPRKDELALPEGEVHATFYCPVLNPNRDEQKYLGDIDEELAHLKVIQDNIRQWHEPKLIAQPKVMIHALIEKLHDDPDLDPVIKNMRDITKTEVTQSAINEINAKKNIEKYEKLKQSLLAKTERKTTDGDSISEGTIGVL